jgi:hypothetical protein
MTQNHVNDNQYRIDNPKYIDPSYNIKYFNKLLEDEHVTTYIPDKLLNHAQQYSNNVNVNKNYKNDLYLSTGLLKYLDSTDLLDYKEYHRDLEQNVLKTKQHTFAELWPIL